MLLTPAQMKPRQSESRRNSFFYPGWMRLMFTCVLGRWVASTVWQSLEEGAGKRCSECDMHVHTHTHTHTHTQRWHQGHFSVLSNQYQPSELAHDVAQQ